MSGNRFTKALRRCGHILHSSAPPVVLGLTLGAPVVAASAELATPSWSRARFEAAIAVAKGSVEVDVKPAPRPRLMDGAKGQPIPATGKSVMLATVEIQARMPFKSKQWIGNVWFDRASGSALQRVRLKVGKDGNRKTYRFGQKGVDRVVARPRNSSEKKLKADQWTDIRHRYLPHPASRSDCAVVSDPLMLIFSVAHVSGDGTETESLCAFNKKTLYHVTLTSEGTEELDANHVLKTDTGTVKVNGPLSASRVLISATPVDPAAPEQDPFEFLGLEGEVRVWVDAAAGLPLAVEGKLPDVGPARFVLTEASRP